MDKLLSLFLADKACFLRDFCSGRIESNPFVAGLIFSCNQKELQNNLCLFQSLDKILFNFREENIKVLCLLKFYAEISSFINFYEENVVLADLFFQFGNVLYYTIFDQRTQEKISESFSKAVTGLLRVFAKSKEMIRIYKISKLNKRFLINSPDIFTDEIETELDFLERLFLKGEVKGFIATIEKICGLLKPKPFYDIQDLINNLA